MYASLIISNQQVHLFNVDDLPLSIKKRISTFDGSVAGSYGRSTIVVPATKQNKSVLLGQKGFLPFRIEVNGSIKFQGQAQVLGGEGGTDNYKCVFESFEIALFADNSDWFLPLRDCRLSDLTDLKVVFNSANIAGGFFATPDSIDYGFTFIKWHEWQNSKPVQDIDEFGNSYQRQLDMPSFYESTPLLYLRPLINAAFNKAGYIVQSNFLNSVVFKQMTMPVPVPEKMPEEYNEAYLNATVERSTFTVPSGGVAGTGPFPYDIQTKTPVENPSVWNPITYEYTVPATGYYEFTLGWTYDSGVSGTFYYYIGKAIKKNGVLIQRNQGGAGFGDGNVFGASLFPTAESRKDSTILFLQTGDVISTEFLRYSDVSFTVNNAYLQIRGEAVKSPGVILDFKYLLGNLKFNDMMKDLANIFKLVFSTDNASKVVTIEPADNYRYTQRSNTASIVFLDEIRQGYYQSGNQQNWTQKIDYNQQVNISYPELEGFIDFQYKEDSEETLEFVNGINKFSLYDARYSTGNGSDESKTKVVKTDFFAKTLHVSDFLATHPDSDFTVQFPLIYPKNYILDPTATPSEAQYKVSPRLLYFAGKRSGAVDGLIELFEAQGLTEENPAAFMVNYNDTSGLDPNLSFFDQSIDNANITGLVKRYHLNCIARMKERFTKEAFLCLNLTENQKFSFADKVFIDGQRYIVQELNIVKPFQNNGTKALLVKDATATEDDLNSLEGSKSKGIVSLI